MPCTLQPDFQLLFLNYNYLEQDPVVRGSRSLRAQVKPLNDQVVYVSLRPIVASWHRLSKKRAKGPIMVTKDTTRGSFCRVCVCRKTKCRQAHGMAPLRIAQTAALLLWAICFLLLQLPASAEESAGFQGSLEETLTNFDHAGTDDDPCEPSNVATSAGTPQDPYIFETFIDHFASSTGYYKFKFWCVLACLSFVLSSESAAA